MKRKNKILLVSAAIISVIATFLLLAVIIISVYSSKFSSDTELFEKSRKWNSTVFYANAAPYSEEYIPVESELSGSIKKAFYSLDEISPYLKDGFIAVEDRIFYKHSGVDLGRTLRAAVNYVCRTKKLYGASTITQQVIKNISGDSDVTLGRKFSEILRALRIEKRYSKDDIMEVYLNVIPMSENMYGVGIASRYYFGKEPSELTPAEAATLIGITNAPSAYNPYSNPEACKRKRDVVLSVMYSEGVINEGEYKSALLEELSVIHKEQWEDRYDSWFVETVIDEASRDFAKEYGLSEAAARIMLLGGGYSVYTTMDESVQSALEDYFENEDNFSSEIKNGLNYAMTVVDSKTGNLLGIVGRVGKKQGNRLLNHATVPHTPASTLKPLGLYAPLIDEGKINWATVFDDVPVSFGESGGEYKEYPRNSPNVYDGLTTVKDAVRLSKNTVAVRLCELRTPERVFETLTDTFGFDTLVRSDKTADGRTLTDIATSPMALRGVSLLKLTESYTVFPAEGVLRPARSYIAVLDSDGNTVLENKSEETRVFKTETARIMNFLLSGVTEDGTAGKITLKNTVDTAGKTGTSGNNKDKMFIGYTPYYTAGIWCGYESGGVSVASLSPSHLEIWDNIMKEIHEKRLATESAPESFSDEGLIYLPYCKDSGAAYTDSCVYDPRGTRLEYGYFTADNRPRGECTRHIKCLYDTETKAIAHSGCPRENLITVSLINIPDRSFPKEIYVTDAEYVYRNISGYDERPIDYTLPYFYYTLPEDEYAGISKRKKQFNSNCYIHDEL